MDKKYLLIIDYNLVRFDDVKVMSDYAKSHYQLQVILIRPNVTEVDNQIADIVIDLDPRSQDFLNIAYQKLQPYHLQFKAGIVFSDNAVFYGAQLLKKLGLSVDSPTLSDAAYSKIIYRQREQNYKLIAQEQNILVPDFEVIYTAADLRNFAASNPAGLVLKPSCEGNNRGVMILRAREDCEQAFEHLHDYLNDGIIAESLIPLEEEFSFDGLAHLNFITEKMTAHGKYPVEYGQIVRAHSEMRLNTLVTQAGRFANFIVGQHSGPFHNEIKLSHSRKMAAVIEPNRRPAGMKIWNLAEKVYGINFYQLWIDSVVSESLPMTLPLPRGVAAIRMLGSSSDGVLSLPDFISENPKSLFDKVLRLMKKRFSFLSSLEWFGFQLNKKNGDSLFKTPKNNADFVAQVCVYSQDETIDMYTVLDELETCWLLCLEEYMMEVVV